MNPEMRIADLMCTLNLASDIHAIIIFIPHCLIALPAELLYAAAMLVNVVVNQSATSL